MSDTTFWKATERHEERFTGTEDTAEFRAQMRRLGHPADAIEQRIADIHPHLAKKA